MSPEQRICGATGARSSDPCLGEQVRAIRLARRFTKEQIAEQLDVTARYYAGLERGERNLTLDSVDVLAGQLDLAVSLTLGAR